MWLLLILIAFVSLLAYYLFFKESKDFWKEYGVTQVPYCSAFDTIQAFLARKTLSDFDQRVYRSMKEDEKVCGIYTVQTPYLLVKDLDVVKKVLIKDFDHFMDRRTFGEVKSQPLVGKMVGNLRGEEWKGVRASLSPTFTTGKIRRMMESFEYVSNEWGKHFNEEIKKNGGKGIEFNVVKETVSYTVDVIASAVFGFHSGAIGNPDAIFAKMSHKVSKVGPKEALKFGLAMNFPKFADLIGLKIIDAEGMDFFEAILRKGLKERMSGTEKRNDFLQLVAEARKGQLKAQGSDELDAFEKDAMINDDSSGEKKNWLNDDTIAIAQMIGFFFAGFSTTSNFIGFMMYCLALNQDVQDKLREEINEELFKDGTDKIDYDTLNQLSYLDMFVCEVQRKFPALGRLERKCNKEYIDTENKFRVPKDAIVIIPVQAIHNDPQYYEFPDKFYPEHFTPENKAKRSPYAYQSFGQGPRACIGMRFALVESKAAIAHLVHQFRIEPARSTPIPFKAKCVGFGVQLLDDLELKISRLS